MGEKRPKCPFVKIAGCARKGDLVESASLGKGMASGRAAEREFRRQTGGMDDDKKEPKHEHDNS